MNNNNNNKVLITDFMSDEELHKRKIFFIFKCMINADLWKQLKRYTEKTGIKFNIENTDKEFIIVKKIL